MTRPPTVPKGVIEQALQNLERTTVLSAGIADYESLPPLHGPSMDMEMMAEIFVEKPELSIYKSDDVIELENPSSSQFRKEIANYVHSRSARGDILVLYFTGHGTILPGSRFGFCFRDTKLYHSGSEILPITVVPLEEIVSTLSIADVHPAFIIDACFSSASTPQGSTLATNVVESTLRDSNADTYALLASSSSQTTSLDTPSGGAFTQALYTIILNGLSGQTNKRSPFITIDQLSTPLQNELSQMGVPLSRCYVGRDFPKLPISKNIKFKPQTVRFAPYMKEIIKLLWQDGDPRTARLSEFSNKIGPGAYANHSKLSHDPWDLVEDVGTNKMRRLSPRGKLFAKGELEIPRTIVKDPFVSEWKPANSTDWVNFDNI